MKQVHDRLSSQQNYGQGNQSQQQGQTGPSDQIFGCQQNSRDNRPQQSGGAQANQGQGTGQQGQPQQDFINYGCLLNNCRPWEHGNRSQQQNAGGIAQQDCVDQFCIDTNTRSAQTQRGQVGGDAQDCIDRLCTHRPVHD